MRDGPLQKPWGDGTFSAGRNFFFSRSLPLHDFFSRSKLLREFFFGGRGEGDIFYHPQS